MSLEQALQENTAAILRLAELLSAQQSVISVGNSNPIEISKAAAEEDNAVVEQSIKKAESVNNTAEQTEESPVTFDEVKAALMQVAKRNRGKLIEILAKFGTDKVNALNEADYSAVIKLADEVLGGAHA
ncbi:hypothetical protein [Acinetobacter sp. ANC 4639]